MRAELHRGIEAVERLTPGWEALLSYDPAATFFHTPRYQSAWAREFADPSAVMLAWGESPEAVCPLVVERGTLRFLAAPDVTDYLGPVSRPEDRDAAAGAIVEAVLPLEWDDATLAGLAQDSGWPDALARAAKSAGLLVEERAFDACPRIALGSSYDAYLESLPGKLRHEIRRKERRLEREAGGYTVRLSDAGTLQTDLDAFFAMHRSSDGPKGKFLHEGMAAFFSRLARSALDVGWLRMVFLESGGRPLAALLAFEWRGTWNVYNSAFDHAARALAPGMVLMSEAIRLAAEEGCATFDLLRGTEEYKYRLGAADRPLVELRIRRA